MRALLDLLVAQQTTRSLTGWEVWEGGRQEDMNTRNHANTDTFSFWHTSLLAELTGHAQFECGDFNRSSIWLENVPKPVCNLNCPDPSNVPFGFIYIMLLGSSSKIQYDPIWSNVWRCFRRFSRMFSLCSTLAFRQLVELFVSAKAWRIHERWGSSAETRKISKIPGSQTSVHQSSEIFDSNSAKADNWMCAPGYAGTVTFYCAFGPNCTLINEPAGSSVILALFCNFSNFFRFICHPFIKNIKISNAFLAFFSLGFILTFSLGSADSAPQLCTLQDVCPSPRVTVWSPHRPSTTAAWKPSSAMALAPVCLATFTASPPTSVHQAVKENTMRNSRNVNHSGIVECEW